MNFSTLGPIDYTIGQTQFTPISKRVTDMMTLADLFDKRKIDQTLQKEAKDTLTRRQMAQATMAGINFPGVPTNLSNRPPEEAPIFTPPAIQPVINPAINQPDQNFIGPPAPSFIGPPAPESEVTMPATSPLGAPVATMAPEASVSGQPSEMTPPEAVKAQLMAPAAEGTLGDPEAQHQLNLEYMQRQERAGQVQKAAEEVPPEYSWMEPNEYDRYLSRAAISPELGDKYLDDIIKRRESLAKTKNLGYRSEPKPEKPEDATKAFKLEAGKHQRVTNMLFQAQTPADIEAAVEEARRYGFDETKLSDNPSEQEISDWVREDQTMQQQLLGMRLDMLKGSKGKFPPIPGNPEPTQGQFYAYKMIKGDAPPDFSFVKGRGQDNQIVVNDIYSELQKMDPNFSPSMAMSDYKYWTSAKTKQQRQAIDAFVTLAAKAKEATDKYKRLPAKMLNRPFMSVAKEIGDVETARYISQLGVLTEDLGKAVAGGNAMTDDQLKFATRILSQDYTPAQFEAAIDAALSGALERKHTIYAQGGVYGRNNARTEDASFWPGPEGEQIRQNIINPQIGAEAPTKTKPGTFIKKRGTSGNPLRPTSQAEYDKYPMGTIYIDTDGITKEKQ